MPILIQRRPDAAAPIDTTRPVAFEMTAPLTGRVGGFLELSQMLTGQVPVRELVLDTCLSGVVPGVAATQHLGRVLDLTMTAGGMPVESFSWSAERGTGTRMDVTVIGDARGQGVPPVTVTAGGQGGVFQAAGTLPEWEHEQDSTGQTTTLHASDKSLQSTATLLELVPWETQAELDALYRQYKAGQIAQIPPLQRPAAKNDPRRMAVDAVVLAALATVPHRILVPAPFPGYDFRAGGDGPSYSTYGKTAEEVVNDIWGKVGIQAGWESGVLVVRPPGPTGDVLLSAPVGHVRTEHITLDAPKIEIEGGMPASDDGTDADGNPKDPKDPSKKDNSPDPDERDGNGSGGFADGISPTPQVGEVAANAVPLSWEAVMGGSQYIVERVEGQSSAYSLWSRVQVTSATRWTDDTVLPLHAYSYRLRVNATAVAGTEQNTIWQPSNPVQVTTPPVDASAPGAVTNLTGYYRSETAVGLKWTPPVADPLDKPAPRKAAADRYLVEMRDTTPAQALVRSVTVFQSWVLLDGLPVGGKLRVTVTAKNGTLAGEPAMLDVQLVNLPPAPLGEVRLETGTDSTTTPWSPGQAASLTATWDTLNGATSYEIRRAVADVGTPEAQLKWTYGENVAAPTTPRDGEQAKTVAQGMASLAFSTRFAVQVRGRNSIGAGAWSAVAYIVTESAPPQPEPDPQMASFEQSTGGSITTSRRTDELATETTVWKSGGRVIASRVQSSGKVALIEKDAAAESTPQGVWLPFDTTTTRLFYELPDWPLTLTASVTEKILYDRSPGRAGQEAGREQEKIHQEWSPQGWLARKTTERTKAAWVIGEEDKDGNIIRRRMGNQREYVLETWHPVGDGLWLYQRSGTIAALTPTYIPGEPDKSGKPTEGEWTHLETSVKPLPGETTVSETAPEQATLPDKQKATEGNGEPPPLPRNTSSPALDKYPLDEPWFSAPPPGTPSNSGPEQANGTDGDPPPAGPNDPPSTPEGSADTSGTPEPDAPPTADPKEPLTYTYTMPGSGDGNGATIQTSIPWVRTAAGLARYAAMLAQQGGPRKRITRTYLLPTTPPGLDQAVSISASGSSNEFEMVVVTETR